MRILITGDQRKSYVFDTLEDIDEHYGIEEILICAASKCAQFVFDWCALKGVPVFALIPDELTQDGIINAHFDLIINERPDILLMYSEERDIAKNLVSLAEDTSTSIKFVIKQREKL